MVYGEEKARDMSRSLLPSKNREAARQARVSIHRAARHQSRAEMTRLVRDPEAFEDFSGLDADVTGDIRCMVWQRRWGDKVSPFIRWAKARTRQLPQASRVSHMRALVPPGVIGEHALQHLERDCHFEHPNETARREALHRRWRESLKNPVLLKPGAQAELLRAVLQAPGGHRTFNRWLKTEPRPQGAPPPRTLQGVHDVRPFLGTLWGPLDALPHRPSPHGPQSYLFDAVNVFLRAFKTCQGDVEATLIALNPSRSRAALLRE